MIRNHVARIGWRAIAAGALFSLVIGACSSDTARRQGAYCDVDADCMIGLVCDRNVCSAPTDVPCEPACNAAAEACFNGSCIVVVDQNDKDADGSPADEDCDDFDRTVRPEIAETCDGVDNNCDEQVDEGCPPCQDGDSRACGDELGECIMGTTTCLGGVWQPCPATRPTVEICDGLDNDCDGLVDEVCPCHEGAEVACSADEGVCAAGFQKCQDGAWSGCVNGILPGAELCDGKDNDCDGVTDDGYQIDDPCEMPGACGAGYLECAGATSLRCSSGPGGSADASRPELCNGLDDDCDDETDEDFAEVGTACDGPDSDFCARGIWACDEEQNGIVCGAEVEVDLLEVCNGNDDDCDGLTDEDFQIGEDCIGLGGCGDGAGRVECAGENNVRCSTNPGGTDFVPRQEACDGVDNDCDGETDEDFPELGTACDGADTDLCANGLWTCKLDTTGLECINETQESIAERCNDLDDDCDGEIDEDFPLKFNHEVCDLTTDNDDCFNGTWDCSPDTSTVECADDNPAAPESCNNSDDDCDTLIDEVDSDGDNNLACMYNKNNNPGQWDCCDSNSAVHPGADYHNAIFTCNDPLNTNYYPGGAAWNRWDWDCSGVVQKEIPDVRVVRLCIWPSCTISTQGWNRALWDPMPSCGQTEFWVTSCEPFSCVSRGYYRTQRCK